MVTNISYYKRHKKEKVLQNIKLVEEIDLDAAARGWMKRSSESSILGGIDYSLTDDYDLREWEKEKEVIRELKEIKIKNPDIDNEIKNLMKKGKVY